MGFFFRRFPGDKGEFFFSAPRRGRIFFILMARVTFFYKNFLPPPNLMVHSLVSVVAEKPALQHGLKKEHTHTHPHTQYNNNIDLSHH